MKTSEMILLVCLAGFAGWLLWESTSMPYHTGYGVGAGFVPLNIAMASLTLIVVLTCKTTGSRPPVSEKEEERRASWQRVRPPIITMILLVITLLVMGFGSVLLPLGGLLVVVSVLLLGHSWPRAVLHSVSTLAFIYAVFSLWLKIPLT